MKQIDFSSHGISRLITNHLKIINVLIIQMLFLSFWFNLYNIYILNAWNWQLLHWRQLRGFLTPFHAKINDFLPHTPLFLTTPHTVQGRHGQGAEGPLPPIRVNSVDFSEIFAIFPLSQKFLSIWFPFPKFFVFGPP